jgi:endonuclease/exonuclease/phosphatase family metal-dependent hydrolase
VQLTSLHGIRTRATRQASDHLPLLAQLSLGE